MIHDDGNLYYPDLGLHIEPTGYTYSYSDFIHIPIAYHVPLDMDISTIIPDRCDLSEGRTFEADIASAFEQAKIDLMTPYKSAFIAGMDDNESRENSTTRNRHQKRA